MPKKQVQKAAHPSATEAYMRKRIHSKEFNKSLSKTLSAYLNELSQKKVGEVLDYHLARKILTEFDPFIIKHEALILLVKDQIVVFEDYFSKRKDLSVASILDQNVNKQIEAFFKERIEFTTYSKEFVSRVIHSDFIRNLFIDTIHISIVSFYKKVNPFFGGLATSMLEKQIRGGIRFIIEIVLDQATDYVVSEKNQERFSDFLRTVVLLMLDEPINHYSDQIHPGHRKKAENVVNQLIKSKAFEDFLREIVLEAFDHLYKKMKNDQINKYISFDKKVQKVVPYLTEMIIPFLDQDSLIGFMAAEMELVQEGR